MGKQVDVATIRTMAADGRTRREIAEALGMSKSWLVRIAKANDIAIEREKTTAHDQGGRRAPSAFWQKNDCLLVELIQAGASLEEIAAELMTTPNAVRSRAQRRKLRWPKQRKMEESKKARERLVNPFPPPSLCVFPLAGHGTAVTFCRAPVASGRPYCAEHTRIAFIIPPRDRNAA